ncbi:hypothetical protein [Klebsiella sp. 2680]|uniref:hypothetical protein n=1 Tax=Klebsiella sp. 2680 TaxID=2018037 RepID=UPI001158D5A1|nr:hypothetical protein [Klebsiella sp. 2680]
MLRQSDINQAFRESILRNPKGHQYLHTHDFMAVLLRHGIHFSESEANRWIQRYQPCFADKTPEHTENRLWILRVMGSVL